MKKQNKIFGTVFIISVALIIALYAGGAGKPDFPKQQIPELGELRDPQVLIPEAEEEHVSNDLSWDNRPIEKEPVKVKGIYMSGAIFNHSQHFMNLVKLVEETELNALVIDMKDDQGYLATEFKTPIATEIKPRIHKGMNARDNMAVLAEKEIYPIARIVVFKDPTLAEGKTELAIKRQDGSIWRDRKGLAWVDPHNKQVWEYAVNIAKEAAKLGFREIQFDYVRFPTDGNISNAVYPYATGETKEDVICNFLAYAKEELEPYNVFLAADVFGLTTLTLDDMGMGQKFEKIMNQVDYICPMVYPSHYGPGNYGFQNPNAYPYEVVKSALLDGLKKSQDSPVIIRPWLQDFNLGKPVYGAAEVRAQIKATYDAGLEEWILWNAGNRYTGKALLKSDL
jgi:hypothetical protein